MLQHSSPPSRRDGNEVSTIRVVHIIPTLSAGGAEGMLTRLVTSTQGRGLHHHVICLSQGGPLKEAIEGVGATTESCRMSKTFPKPTDLLKIRSMAMRQEPHIIQTWMYHADLIGALVAIGTGVPVVWNLRRAGVDRSHHGWRTNLVISLCARLSSRLPTTIISGSFAAQKAHVQRKYDGQKISVITNGYDTDRFSPDQVARKELRESLRLPEDAYCIGFGARLHPSKDHATLLEGFASISSTWKNAHLILFGRDITPSHPFWIEQRTNGLVGPRVHLLGEQRIPEKILKGLDLFVSPSATEGFPNAIAEAMSCGVPCIVTDVGDSAHLVNSTGYVVPPKDPPALKDAIERFLNLSSAARQDLGNQARKRIVEEFSIHRIAGEYHSLYKQLVSGPES